MVPVTRLDHAVIAVSDWRVSTDFYRDVVGAEVISVGGDRVAFRVGPNQLNVHGPGVDLADNVARLPVRPGNSDICFVWEGPIEEAVAHLRQHNVEVETGPVRRFGAGGTGASVYFRDPDGSLLEFISYEASPQPASPDPAARTGQQAAVQALPMETDTYGFSSETMNGV
ncbi:VOC family protein [Micromonospora olivasterospora]|uniref:Catechol 2,3-dioxygenase-like lactoylglutathione lyase family enzyme n=1 Tax=Micromonospora olivasterospora TaxID=1880 RepID=A0A562I7Y3_MICOL|nr:VOC family protein [Micromonospora olivasterospora]TWH66835.1 catechol 2,3-dioxygenase-like lactoylglutathione lyase family enzyme [Micromonospora olivasterospora]